MKGWFRPWKRSAWHLVPYWRRLHKFMSVHALFLGSTVLSVLIAIGSGKSTLIMTLIITVVATLIGALVEQPEVKDEPSNPAD